MANIWILEQRLEKTLFTTSSKWKNQIAQVVRIWRIWKSLQKFRRRMGENQLIIILMEWPRIIFYFLKCPTGLISSKCLQEKLKKNHTRKNPIYNNNFEIFQAKLRGIPPAQALEYHEEFNSVIKVANHKTGQNLSIRLETKGKKISDLLIFFSINCIYSQISNKWHKI